MPAADVPLFLGRVLPGLRGRVDEVRASGVDLPEAPAPTLVCDVEHRGGQIAVVVRGALWFTHTAIVTWLTDGRHHHPSALH